MIPGALRGPQSLRRSRNNETKPKPATDSPCHSIELTLAMRRLLGVFAVTLLAAAPALGWEHWGGDRSGTRFSPLTQITRNNVGNLVRAWEFRTGDLDIRAPAVMARSKFQATPLFVEDSIIFCSPFNEVIALDPGSGAQKWRYDPKISTNQRPGNRYVCRGVAYCKFNEQQA
jgi:quinoprotein glucose dehydrogenase